LRSRKRKVEVDRMISSPMTVDPSKVTTERDLGHGT
jgi:hypothetical protein